MSDNRKTRRKSNNTKIFYDWIRHYNDLQYMFKYNFDLDKELYTLMTGQKNHQSLAELNRIFQTVQEYMPLDYSYNYQEKGQNRTDKKNKRQISKKNTYNLQNQQPWHSSLIGLFGQKTDDGEAVKGDIEQNRFQENINEVKGRYFDAVSCDDIKDTDLLEELAYDVFTHVKTAKGVRGLGLRENNWTQETGLSDGTFSNLDEYQDFIEMIRFFAAFAPMSILGSNFLRRTLAQEDQSSQYLLIRNQPVDYGIEQEYIYRCSYARRMEYSVCIVDETGTEREYIPLKLFYRDRNLYGLKAHLYLAALPVMEDTEEEAVIGKPVLIPLYRGVLLWVHFKGRKKVCKQFYQRLADINMDTFLKEIQEEKSFPFTVHFYSNEVSEYLLNRLQYQWKHLESGKRRWLDGKKIRFDSPYHKDLNEWSVREVRYQIPKSDLEGFELYIRSFGEFAKVIEGNEWFEQKKETALPFSKVDSRKSAYQKAGSLLSLYNSTELIEEIQKKQKKTDKKGEKILCSGSLPPRLEELRWILMVMETCPNLCQMFLPSEQCTKIKQRLQNEIESVLEQVSWYAPDIDTTEWMLDPAFYAYEDRLRDIETGKIVKYQKAYQEIKYGQKQDSKHVLYLEEKGELEPFLAYAMEYDVMKHLTDTAERSPLSIMCYNIKEKRNVLITHERLRFFKEIEETGPVFSQYDKIFHIIAYAARCAAEGAAEINDAMEEVLKIILERDHRTENSKQYVRLFKKKYNPSSRKNWSEAEWIEQFEKDYTCFWKKYPDLNLYQQQYFEFYHAVAADAEKQIHTVIDWQYILLLLQNFIAAANYTIKYSDADALKKSLPSDADILKLIGGEQTVLNGVQVPNEIAFYNEKFKHTQVSFTLRPEYCSREMIDRVHEVFSGFTYVGKKLAGGQDSQQYRLRFTVTYEAFQYRKIHMGLMAVENMIEDIRPDEVKSIIEARKQNQIRL